MRTLGVELNHLECLVCTKHETKNNLQPPVASAYIVFTAHRVPLTHRGQGTSAALSCTVVVLNYWIEALSLNHNPIGLKALLNCESPVN